MEIDHDFFQLSRELARWMAAEGHTLVYGGCNRGLMESLAKAMHEAGGRVIGVVPSAVVEQEWVSKYLDKEITCKNLNDRKEIMLERSDAFIALPGGIGTLDEVFTMAGLATMDYHDKPIILYNMKGFWNFLVDFLDELHTRNVTRKQWRNYIQVADTLDDVQRILSEL